MNINKRTIVGGIVIVGVLWYAGTHSEGLDPAGTPAPSATSSQDVTDHGAYHPDGDCWSLGMSLPPRPGMDGVANMRSKRETKRTMITFDAEVFALIETYMAKTDRNLSLAVNWLCKRQLTLLEQDPAQDVAS